MTGIKPFFLKYFLWVPLVTYSVQAQHSSGEFQNNPLKDTYPVQLYFNAIAENAHIYNGYEYRTPDRNITGSPYFLSDDMVPANITYDDGYYQNIPALYDLVRDLVIIDRLNQNFKISLIPEKLREFTIQNHDFIRIVKDSLRGVNLSTGFYDRLYAGKTTVLVSRRKLIQDLMLYDVTKLNYGEVNNHYVRFKGKYVLVNNKSAALKLFKERKSEIKTYIRRNKLNLKSEFEKTLVAVSAYYDQLPS